MDKIYSRKRIKIPRLNIFYSNNRKMNKLPKLLIILLIAAITFAMAVSAINPMFVEMSRIKARNVATDIINFEANRILSYYNYTSLITPIGNESDAPNILTIDVATINQMSTEIVLAVERRLEDLRDEQIDIPIGAFTGSALLSGMGPSVGIRVISRGNVRSELRSEFESRGINQTVYRIYLALTGEVSIFTPYNTIDEQISHQVLLLETVIVGDVPDTYLHIDRELNRLNLNQ
ncbi:MAG: sporulation protein YunB [Oscillospiraceae bacterium]|nr:sporulation protein YunB [Oscillospiraceae bacterium]